MIVKICEKVRKFIINRVFEDTVNQAIEHWVVFDNKAKNKNSIVETAGSFSKRLLFFCDEKNEIKKNPSQ